MIPYFEIYSFGIGLLTVYVWGLLVALGMLAGLLLSLKLAKVRALSSLVIMDMSIWGIVGGLLGGRLFYVLFYAPDYFLANPSEIVKFWNGGASSLGGFIGAGLAIFLLVKIKHFGSKEVLPYLDILGVSFWLSWAIGRIGCFLIHDHPGRLTSYWLAVNFPAGARYDLGLIEVLLSLIIFIFVFNWLKKYHNRPGLTLAVGFWLYSLARFFFDFLRAEDLPQSDIRWLALTPAQWGMGILFIAITTIMIVYKKQRQ